MLEFLLISFLAFSQDPVGYVALDPEKNEMPLKAGKTELIADLMSVKDASKKWIDSDFKNPKSLFSFYYDAGLSEFALVPASFDAKTKKWKAEIHPAVDGRYFLHAFGILKDQKDLQFSSGSFSVYGGAKANALMGKKIKPSLSVNEKLLSGKLEVKKQKSGEVTFDLKLTSKDKIQLQNWRDDIEALVLISDLSGETFDFAIAKADSKNGKLSAVSKSFNDKAFRRVWVVFKESKQEYIWPFLVQF